MEASSIPKRIALALVATALIVAALLLPDRQQEVCHRTYEAGMGNWRAEIVECPD